MLDANEVKQAVRFWREFKVVAVSANANSFGLTGHVLVDRAGRAYEVGRSRCGPFPEPWNQGDVVRVQLDPDTGDPLWAVASCEIPRHLKPDMPMKLIKEVWKS